MSLSELCVRRPVFATTLVVTLVVLGIFSFRDLGVDLFPKADPATVNVFIQLPGASPDEITTSVIEPLEDALSGVSGIDQMNSRANEGVAYITLRFVLERDLNDAANSVCEKVAGAMRKLPPQVLPPIIQEADPDADPIMTLVLSSKTVTLRALTEIADKQVKRAIESVNGVAGQNLRPRLRRGRDRASRQHALDGQRRAGRSARHSTRIRREHHRRHRGGQAEAENDSAGAPQSRGIDDDAR